MEHNNCQDTKPTRNQTGPHKARHEPNAPPPGRSSAIRKRLTARPNALPRLLTLRETAVILRIGEWTVRQLILTGTLSGYQYVRGGAYRISEEAVLDLLAKSDSAPASKRAAK
jgi:excisionase family DNA binding protein